MATSFVSYWYFLNISFPTLSVHAQWLLSIYRYLYSACSAMAWQQMDSTGMLVRDWWFHTHIDMHEWLLTGFVNRSVNMSCPYAGHSNILRSSLFSVLTRAQHDSKVMKHVGDFSNNLYLLYLMCICYILCVFVISYVYLLYLMCICCILCVFVVSYVYLLYLMCICCI